MESGISVKRIYEPPAPADGQRILVDRLWPRGMRKEAAALTLWLKEIAPSTELRQWFHANPDHWEDFCRRYRLELDGNPDAVAQLRASLKAGHVTLLYAAHDTQHNQALFLADYIRATEG